MLEVKILRFTDKAVLISESDRDGVWIPFSQIVEPDERYIRECKDQEIEIEIPNWLAEQEGLI